MYGQLRSIDMMTPEFSNDRIPDAMSVGTDLGGALPQRVEQLRNLIQSNADGMLVVDTQGVTRFVNPAAEVLLGRAGDTLLNEPFGFPIIAGEKTEVDVQSHTAKPLVAELRTAEITWEGHQAFLISLRDITDRKALERSLQSRTEALETTIGELEAFSYMISHDLWNHVRHIGQLATALNAGKKRPLAIAAKLK